jgi:intein/homing endonuclease
MLDRFEQRSIKLDWETNVGTKPLLCQYVGACLTANILEINSEELVDEMLSFVRNMNNSGEADYNCHDDLCCLPGTLITCNPEEKVIENLIVGEKVLTHSGNYQTVIKKYNHNYTGKIIKLHISGLINPLQVTENHPILIAKRPYKQIRWDRAYSTLIPQWLEAGVIQEKDYVFIPKRNLPQTKLSKDFLYLLGWYLSDGYVSPAGDLQITLSKTERTLAEKLKSILIILRNEFEALTWRGQRSSEPHLIDNENYIRITFRNQILTHLIKTLCGGPKEDKWIRDDLYLSSGLLPLALGFLEGDGSQSKEGSLRNMISFVQKNKKLGNQIRQILLDNSIWCTAIINKLDQFQVTIPTSGIIILLSQIESLKFQLPEFTSIRMVARPEKDGFWTPITHIEKLNYSGPVFNLEVENDNSYIANNIAVHNCMAYMIGVFCLDQTYNVGSLLQHLGLFKERVTDNAPKRTIRVDRTNHDFEMIFDDGDLVEQNDRSWLNY